MRSKFFFFQFAKKLFSLRGGSSIKYHSALLLSANFYKQSVFRSCISVEPHQGCNILWKQLLLKHLSSIPEFARKLLGKIQYNKDKAPSWNTKGPWHFQESAQQCWRVFQRDNQCKTFEGVTFGWICWRNKVELYFVHIQLLYALDLNQPGPFDISSAV